MKGLVASSVSRAFSRLPGGAGVAPNRTNRPLPSGASACRFSGTAPGCTGQVAGRVTSRPPGRGARGKPAGGSPGPGGPVAGGGAGAAGPVAGVRVRVGALPATPAPPGTPAAVADSDGGDGVCPLSAAADRACRRCTSYVTSA